MVQVFSFRLLERLSGLGAQAWRLVAGPEASRGDRGGRTEPSPGQTDSADTGVFRTATEKLATSASVVSPADTAAPRDLPGPALPETGAVAGAIAAEDDPRRDLDAKQPASEALGSAGRNGLTSNEQAAFQAIAAMLGPRIGSGAAPQSEPGRNNTSVETEPRRDAGIAVPRMTAENRGIFDLVPLGIVVFRERDPVFVNRFLLDLLGVADIGAALAAGRFDSIGGRLRGTTLGAEIVEVMGGNGSIAMIASTHSILWDEAVATLACLRPCPESGWKRIEEELRDARRDAERASALKSDFLAKVSHEIRTPLNAILGFVEVILDERFGPIGNARYKDYLKDIHASGAHVMSLVNDLLDLSKIEAGKMDLAFAPVDANAVVAECVSIMQPEASRERVAVRLSLWPELPPVLADERSLRQIVLNLLSNAVKFNEPGGQVVVTTGLAASGQALLRVKDTGIGMSDAEIEIALEPFRRIEGTKASVGTGLGLPLTKALVEANRARFSISSKKSEGTLIEIAFPPA